MKDAKRHISDDELDQLFRDAHAVEGSEPLFVPEFWSEMEAMLPTETKKRILLPWISLAATLALGLFLIYYPSNHSVITELAHQSTNDSVSNKNADTRIKEQQQLVSVVENTVKEETITTIKTKVQKIQVAPNLKKETNLALQDELVKTDSPDSNTEGLATDSIQLKEQVSNLEDLSFSKLDFIELKGNTDGIVIPEERLKKELPSLNNWYVELGPTLGQSPYLSNDTKRNLVAGAVLGAGYSVKMDQTSITFGLQARMEGFGGLNYQETNFSPGIVRSVSVKQLYSIDLPIKFGYQFGRSEIAFGVIPGIQLFMHGKEQITENQVVTRTASYTGKVQHSSTMSMEFGFQYYYRFAPTYSIGAKINADVLRPFHTDYYLGKAAGFPLNGQIVLRKTFGK
ncbi:hypothetical protein [Fluviicola taffensis]|uniref:Outer membrane protein beta-barrel domain-containing protein n=1 Tax=Fluviicola taffensis (strain DSM 16823 / NCIMB 13979 / RW262) TaxID=755732 RepID=F2I9Q1_FLUTR|nr:hypothetical protein [Fluviicola taffensis]AEA43047.1 hypothetical protein Fluta_1049 [Fluviicola taffensis DSM 16823]